MKPINADTIRKYGEHFSVVLNPTRFDLVFKGGFYGLTLSSKVSGTKLTVKILQADRIYTSKIWVFRDDDSQNKSYLKK